MLAKANNKQESEEVNMDKWEAKQRYVERKNREPGLQGMKEREQ